MKKRIFRVNSAGSVPVPSGGYATQVLADMGAEVIKVEDTARGIFCHDEPVDQWGELLFYSTCKE